MKRKLFTVSLWIAASLTAVSCDDDKVVADVDLPNSARVFLSTYFGGVNVRRIEREEGTGYSVQLTNRTEVDFDGNGNWIEVEGEDGVYIPTGFILPAITTYVDDTYPHDGINGIEKHAAGYQVELVKQDAGLLFDNAGSFVRIDP